MDRLYQHFGLKPPVEEPPSTAERVITIESAKDSSYFKVEQPNEQYLRLSGGVDLKLVDNKTGDIHEIRADEIVFNQTEQILTARGNIEYTITRGTSKEVFNGQGLTFRLNDWDGFFINGTSHRTQQIDGKPIDFSFTGNYISRSKDNIVVLDGGIITSSKAKPPYYSIRARKIWVLAQGEWGLQDAVLYVGHIPVFYLPFFFKPGDQVIFHPAIGYRSREGSFLQSTVYIIGQKKDTSSPLSFLQIGEDATNAPREPHGLFLRLKKTPSNTGPAPAGSTNQWVLKAMADVYTRLGALLALQGDFPSAAKGTDISFYAGIAGTRNLYNTGLTSAAGTVYSPFYTDSNNNLISVWNNTWLFGAPIPLRYRFEFSARVQNPILNLSFALPFYSDPYFLEDFGNRSEGMDWGQLLGLAGATVQTQPVKTTFTWQLSSSLNLPTKTTSPVLSALSVSRLNASLGWQSAQITTGTGPGGTVPLEISQADRSPSEYFYYPGLLILPDLGLHAAGTLLSFPSNSASAAAARKTEEGVSSLIPPWEQAKSGKSPTPADKNPFILPSLQADIASAAIPNLLGFKLGYDVSPGLLMQAQTDSTGWTNPSLVDYRLQYWTLQSQDLASLSYGANLYGSLLSLTGSLSFAAQYRSVFARDANLDNATWQNLSTQAAAFSSANVTNSVTLTTQPLQGVQALSQSTLSYNLAFLMFRRQFDLTGTQTYNNSFVTWDQNGVKAHSVQLNLNAQALAANQQLQLRAVLPPLQQQFTGALTLQTGPFRHNLTAGITYPQPGTAGPPTYQPVIGTETVQFGTLGQFQQTAQYDPQSALLKQAISSLTLGPLTAGLTFNYVDSYSFGGVGVGWVDQNDPALRAQSFNLGVNENYQPDPMWKNRIRLSAAVNSQWQLNLLRFTDSTFTFGLNFTISISQFLNLTFSSLSQNNLTFLYIPAYAEQLGQQWRNPLTDLLKSFNFFNRQDRQDSAFKIQQFSVTAEHDLGDWTLSLSYSGSPQVSTSTTGQSVYQWTSQVSIAVAWKPIPEVKGGVQVNNGTMDINQFTSNSQTQATTTP